MAKPVSDKCNLKCEYCFYLGTADSLSSKPTECMSDETLERFVQQYIAQANTPQVSFVWQGGEPTLQVSTSFEKRYRFKRNTPMEKPLPIRCKPTASPSISNGSRS
nr:4Fe-4S cluster-binding domain-containing protein [Enterovibrio coralii]